MRKALLFIGTLASAIFMAGCTKEIIDSESAENVERHLVVDITVTQDSPSTRAVKTGWEKDDKIYVVFDDHLGDVATKTAYYMTLTYDGSNWASDFSDPALEKYLLGRESGLLSAAYLNYDPGLYCRDKSSVLYVSNSKSGIRMLANDSNKEVSYTVSDGKLKATLPMSVYSGDVQFYLDGVSETEAGNYVLNNEFVMDAQFYGFAVSGSNPFPSSANGYYGKDLPGTAYKGGAVFCGILLKDVNGIEKTYVVKITDTKGTADKTDDVVYQLTKTATLKFNDSVKLPALNSGKWTIVQ